MDLKQILTESIKESFNANAKLRAIEVKIANVTKTYLTTKYRDSVLKYKGLEYELGGVRVSFRNYIEELEIEEVGINLFWLCSSKLPKNKKECVEQAKSQYKAGMCVGDSNHKIPLWHELRYNVSVDEALSGDFNLDFYNI